MEGKYLLLEVLKKNKVVNYNFHFVILILKKRVVIFKNMKKQYLPYITDDHLLQCIGNLYKAYAQAKSKFTKKKFYSNKVDTLKFTFDAHFNHLTEEQLINFEIKRQIDKSITNAIGTFHEEILGGIEGFEMGNKSVYDIKATDNTLFADIKNKHNTMNSSSAEALYKKLERFADSLPEATCYWVQIWATNSFNEPWKTTFKNKTYHHPRVFKISGDQFYALLSGHHDALFQLYKVLPQAITDFRKSLGSQEKQDSISALEEIKSGAIETERTIIDQIAAENFRYYLGFEEL